MAQIHLKGNPINTYNDLPPVGVIAPNFKLTAGDLSDKTLADFAGKKIVLNIFPSIDTPVCATSVRKFNAEADKLADTVVLCISRDLPFAQGRFCGAEGLNNVISLSEMKDGNFGRDYGVEIVDGPLASLCARAVVVIGADGKIIYNELVSDIVIEPNYEAALQALK